MGVAGFVLFRRSMSCGALDAGWIFINRDHAGFDFGLAESSEERDYA